MSNKIVEDVRIQKTRRDLRNALIELLKEMPFEKITVVDICNKALVNRVTFYKYYEDKIQLLNDTLMVFEDILLEKVSVEAEPNVDKAIEFCKELFSTTINECIEYEDIIDALTNQNNVVIDHIIQNMIHQFIFEFIKIIDTFKPFRYPIELISKFVEGGCTQTIYYWLGHQQSYPKDKLEEAFGEIITSLANNTLLFK